MEAEITKIERIAKWICWGTSLLVWGDRNDGDVHHTREGKAGKMRAGALIASVVFIICSQSALMADSYFVSLSGNDQNPGTEAAPFQTIGKAATVAKEGDTVLVKPGVYSGGIGIGHGGTPEKPITYTASGGEVKIVGRVEQKNGFKLTEGKKATYEVEDSGTIAGVAADLDTTKIVIEGLEPVRSIDEVEAGAFRWFQDKQNGKLYLRLASENPEQGHTIHVLRDSQGMAISGSNLVIDGFSLSGFGHNCIGIEGAKNVTLRNCRMSLCGFPWGGGVNLYKTNSVKISNCVLYRLMNGILMGETTGTEVSHVTLYRTRAHGVIINGGVDNAIRNSILFAGGPSGCSVYVHKDAATGLKLDYNCYLDYTTSVLISWMPLDGRYPTFWDYRAAIKSQDQHSISDDPLFVSTEQGKEDFHLKPGSPCKGKAEEGDNIGANVAAS